MAYNSTVILTGNLGSAPKTIEGLNKTFTTFSLATTDSYQEKDSGEWKNKETQWHEVVVFGSKLMEQAQQLEKGNRVKVTGSLTYKSREVFDNEGKSFSIKEARVIAGKIEDAPLEKNKPEVA